MPASHWSAYHRRWSQLKPPLRPHEDVVAALKQAIAGHEAKVLLLGVTPELADVGTNTIAVDRSAEMIAHIWPGDTPRRRAIREDWRDMTLETQSVTAAIGDGALNMLPYAQGHAAFFTQLARVLQPGGIFVCRLFAAPATKDSVSTVVAHAHAGHEKSFHAFKWRLAMAIASDSGNANVAVTNIRDAVQQNFPDRQTAPWPREDIDTIDVYAQSPEAYCFPTRAEFARLIPAEFGAVRFVEVGDYPLAECCPLLVMERKP